MTPYRELSQEQLQAMKAELEVQFEEVKAKGLNLDMSRGCLLYTSTDDSGEKNENPYGNGAYGTGRTSCPCPCLSRANFK